MRRLPILIPHRPGCADFPLPVLHGRASLAEVQMTPSVTCRQRKTRGRTSALVSILASSATRCRFVDRFVRLKVLSHVSRQRFSPHGTPVPTANSKPLTATANRLILAPDERSLQVDLVRPDRTVQVAGCVGSRDPGPSTPTQRAAAQITEAIGVRQY